MISDLAKKSLEKLDGVWSVQLFFRTWPYYVMRANNRSTDPFKDFTVVMSENVPLPDLPPEIEIQFNTYSEQMWAMSLIYLEAVLEGYLLEVVRKFPVATKRFPRQASLLLETLERQYQKKYGTLLSLSNEDRLQLRELAETRHLWVHKDGIVDQTYIASTEAWWKNKSTQWFEPKPVLGTKRRLSEVYVKDNIRFSKYLVTKIAEQLQQES